MASVRGAVLFVLVATAESGGQAALEETCAFGADTNVCGSSDGSVLLQHTSASQRMAIDVSSEMAELDGSEPLTVTLDEAAFVQAADDSKYDVMNANSTEGTEYIQGELKIESMGPTPEEWVKWHNIYRCMHGAPAVKWNDDVAKSAHDYTWPLTQMKHSKSYQVPPPAGPAGENIFWTSSSVTAKSAVEAWYSEVDNCIPSPTEFTDGCGKGKGTTGHFTAMIWNTVKEIGCSLNSAGKIALCRYKAGDSLTMDTPNMYPLSNYNTHVLKRSKTKEQCSDKSDWPEAKAEEAGSDSDADDGDDGEAKQISSEYPCVTMKGACTFTLKGCPGYMKIKFGCKANPNGPYKKYAGMTLTMGTMLPPTYEQDLSSKCSKCGPVNSVEKMR